MPFPWKLPTEAEADELYRRIDQLITDLYHLIRSIFFRHPPLPQQDDPTEEPVPDLLAHLGPVSDDTNSKDTDDPPQPPIR